MFQSSFNHGLHDDPRDSPPSPSRAMHGPEQASARLRADRAKLAKLLAALTVGGGSKFAGGSSDGPAQCVRGMGLDASAIAELYSFDGTGCLDVDEARGDRGGDFSGRERARARAERRESAGDAARMRGSARARAAIGTRTRDARGGFPSARAVTMARARPAGAHPRGGHRRRAVR